MTNFRGMKEPRCSPQAWRTATCPNSVTGLRFEFLLQIVQSTSNDRLVGLRSYIPPCRVGGQNERHRHSFARSNSFRFVLRKISSTVDGCLYFPLVKRLF